MEGLGVTAFQLFMDHVLQLHQRLADREVGRVELCKGFSPLDSRHLTGALKYPELKVVRTFFWSAANNKDRMCVTRVMSEGVSQRDYAVQRILSSLNPISCETAMTTLTFAPSDMTEVSSTMLHMNSHASFLG